MAIKELKHSIQKQDLGRVDLVIARLLSFSRARVRGLIDHGGVQLNGEPCGDGGTLVKDEDRLLLRFDPQRQYREKPQARSTHGFTVVYKDEHLVLVNKEAGILTVPSDRGERNSLLDLLSRHIFYQRTGSTKLSVVHRLDRDTSGLLVFGMRLGIASKLIKQFAARKPEREYTAIVAGKVLQDRGEIRSFLHTDKALNQKSGPQGELAITHYEVLKRFPDATLLKVWLETGRRNQIRVHFAELGHPVLGDERYEKERAQHRAWPHRRLALHARVLGFEHPVSGEKCRFETELPREFAAFGQR